MLQTEKLKETGHGGCVLQNTMVNYQLCYRTLQWPHAHYTVFLYHHSFLWWWRQHKPHLTTTGCNKTSKQSNLKGCEVLKYKNNRDKRFISDWFLGSAFLHTSVGFFILRFPTFSYGCCLQQRVLHTASWFLLHYKSLWKASNHSLLKPAINLTE